jgi:hypothetical protein
MALYSVSNLEAGTQQAFAASPGKSLVLISAATATLKRLKLFDFSIGPDSQPNATDCSIDWDLSRFTTSVGTGTSGTANPYDPADAASGAVVTLNNTAEPTYSAAGAGLSLWSIGLNQRNSYRWACAPGFEYVVPAVNLNGLGLRAKNSATYTGTGVATMHWQDQ